jgi:hypothetical protein
MPAPRTLTKIALDSIPALRLKLLVTLDSADDVMSTTAAAEAVDYPRNTAGRALEDLMAHGLVKRRSQGQGKADLWTLTPWTQDRIRDIGGFPAKASDIHSSCKELNDIAGKVSD